MDKIVGFSISKHKINHDGIDVFNRGLNKIEFQKNGFNIYLWGIGNIRKCVIGGKYCLSFPVSENLLDRNVLIYFSDKDVIIENDWLGSIPIFYNDRELIVSTLCLKTLRSKEISPEGLNSYFEFGYSVFGQTPFSDSKFLRYFSQIIITEGGLTVKHKQDPAANQGLFDETVDERDVLMKIKQYINNIEAVTQKEIIIPTSGGYDSRLLNFLVEDKDRIRSFTYGLSKIQSKSYEAVYAKQLSKRLKTKWQQIELGYFYNQMSEWFSLYGFSTQLHGMYHIEFYKKIIENNSFSKDATFLSGIFGDVWAGGVSYREIKHHRDLLTLGYTHGVSLSRKNFVLADEEKLKKEFILNNREKLKNNKIKALFTIRLKLMLISYLTQIPEYFGFPVFTPFLNFDIAISLLNIKENRWRNRLWQRELFKQQILNFEDRGYSVDRNNYLMYHAFLNYDFEPIDTDLVKKYLAKSYLKKINREMLNKQMLVRLKNIAFAYRYTRGCAKRILGMKVAYTDYIIIKAIEMALRS